MERLRDMKVEIVIDTNKATYGETFTLQESETVDELMERVRNFVETYTEDL